MILVSDIVIFNQLEYCLSPDETKMPMIRLAEAVIECASKVYPVFDSDRFKVQFVERPRHSKNWWAIVNMEGE